jgi:transcriptional regulator
VYVPAAFAQNDRAVLHDFIDRHGFAALCSVGPDGVPFVSHLPLLLDRRGTATGVLFGHMARANPQWRHADGQRVLAVFSGPHAYVSPSWYKADEVVPTWNYVAVHAAGVFRAVHDRDALLRIVQDSIAFFEGGRPQPWTFDASSAYADRMLRGIVGFRIEIETLEGKWKLSQNQPPERREKVRRALAERGGEDADVARLMEENRHEPPA